MKTQKLGYALLTATLSISLLISPPALAAEFVVVVNAKNPISSLTSEQVSQIFLGKVATFPSGEQAMPIDQIDGSDVRKKFYLKVANKSVTQLNAYRANMIFANKGLPPKEVPDNGVAKRLVADNPNVIGYIDKNTVDGSVKVVLQP